MKTSKTMSQNKNNAPWLDDLSDDWVPVPGTPSPVPARSIHHSRHSSSQSHGQKDSPSRIPIRPPRRSVEQSPAAPEKKVTRPCHFIKREAPTPKARRTPITPSKLRSPMPKNSPDPNIDSPRRKSLSKPTNSPKPARTPKSVTSSPKPNTPAAARKQTGAVDPRSPLRSVSNISSQPSQQDTVQVRPKKKSNEKESTPEWRKRLIRGEMPKGGQRDLFVPIGLESVFKPPTPGSEAKRRDQIPMMNNSDDIWNFNDGIPEQPPAMKDSAKENGNASRRKGDPKGKKPALEKENSKPKDDRNTDTSPPGSPNDALEVKKDTEANESPQEQNRHHNGSHNETQSRTASGLEDLRNEGITPFTFSQANTIEGSGTSEVVKSVLKQVTDKLEGLSLSPEKRPGSRASDSALLHPRDDQEDSPEEVLPEDDLLDITSNLLPQDLSMGTLDHTGRAAFAKFRRTEHLGDGSFLKPHLTSSPFPSQRLALLASGKARIRSSPPFYLKANPLTDPPTLPRPSSTRVRSSSTKHSGKTDEGMPSSRSPLKLFGEHDTFTNNRLLRRMSQFEETLDGSSDEDNAPMSPSEEARRKGQNRSLLSSVRSERHSARRPKPRASLTPHVSRFGDGELDNFDFSDTSPYEPKLLYNEIPPPDRHLSSRRRSSISRRNFRRTSNYDHESRAAQQGTDREPAEGDSLGYVEVKQASNIASREKNPKRRRTILRPGSPNLASDDAGNRGHTDHLSLLQRSLMQHGIEEMHDNHLGQSRSTQRPRSLTPSHVRSSRKRPSSHWTQPSNGHIVEESPPANGVPKVKVTGANDESRKGSLSTQDYLNEATQVMNMIRSRGTTVGGMPSLEELDVENDEDLFDEESTREEFSRPPSRDGVDLRKQRETTQETNPRILSHLKKFQEDDDPDFGVGTSVASLDLEQDQQPEPFPDETHIDERSRDGENTPNNPSSNTNELAKSIPTGSSQASHAKGVLSSDLVSHLIPEQVNGFTYDRFKHLWVKGNPERSREPKRDESEEDPFRGIPDLSVDELQEMMKIHSSSSPTKPDYTFLTEDHDPKSPLSAKVRNLSMQPQKRDAAVSGGTASTFQSRASRFTSSDPNSGTRATSWDTDEQKHREFSSEVEHEIQLHEGRLSKPPRRQNSSQQARVVTISFSSPLVSDAANGEGHNQEKPDDGQALQQEAKPSMLPPPQKTIDDSSLQRSITRIDEADADKAEGLDVARQNTEGGLSTPLKPQTENSLVRFRETEADSSYSFYLSPLPDFTIHQNDQTLPYELSYVGQRTNPTSFHQVHGKFALATENLIKHLTEVEPFEPYWEHVRRLILRDKGLVSLLKLSEFCHRLEDLDVSDNDIGQLSGIPASLRTLRIQRNCLSSLTAWGHLVNLQYLDVSGNDLESLDGFGSLIHLREIKANDNNIQNIDGVLDLNGLLSLKLSHNSLTAVNFEDAELARLTELDLSHNELVTVRNLNSLSALSTVDLSFNQLTDLDFPAPMHSLRSLRLSDNSLHALDTTMLPSLVLLYVDQNSLTTITGLEKCHNLEILSAREQYVSEDRVSPYFDIDLGLIRDIRKVYLSSNRLSAQSVSPSAPLLSLQLFDIASCKLENLPTEFSLSFPNVKVLNLNFNALTGVTELAGMNCLSRLTVAGNRISRMRKLCQALSRIGRTRRDNSTCSLQKVDLRGNPLTVRFYPPPITGSGKDKETKRLQAQEAAATTARAERGRNSRSRGKPTNTAGYDLSAVLADINQQDEADNITHWAIAEDNEGHDPKGPEINDPYTLPPADPQTDIKYFSRLDEATRLRRRVLELMIYAGTSGSVKYLDGLAFRPEIGEGSDMDVAWGRLEELGVLRRKGITA